MTGILVNSTSPIEYIKGMETNVRRVWQESTKHGPLGISEKIDLFLALKNIWNSEEKIKRFRKQRHLVL